MSRELADLEDIRAENERLRRCLAIAEADHESNCLFRQAIETLPHGLAVIAADGTILDCNSQLNDLLRLAKEQVLGRVDK
jgi:PAS domain-containing protein